LRAVHRRIGEDDGISDVDFVSADRSIEHSAKCRTSAGVMIPRFGVRLRLPHFLRRFGLPGLRSWPRFACGGRQRQFGRIETKPPRCLEECR
jgi:hypothetical protein